VVPKTTDIEVRPARGAAERHAALELRREVFVDEQGISPRLEADHRDADAIHLVAVRDQQVVGTCRVVVDAATAKLGRLAVRRGARGAGAGTALVAAAEAQARAAGAGRMALHAQAHATGVYAARGFVRLGAPFREAGIEHIRMEKQLA
jgi:predicted GNAT family N-acyltransferase